MTIFWLLSLYTLSRCVASPDDRITLNFSSVDTPKVSVFEGFDNGFAFESYTVHKGFGISSIVNGQEEVWRASPGEKAVLAVWYKYDGLPLVAVDVRKGGVSTTQCYEKNGNGEWKKITEENYDKKLEDLKNEPTKKSAKANDQSEDSPNIPPQSEAPPSEEPESKKKNSKK